MWARKRIDLSNWGLLRAIGTCFFPSAKQSSIARIVDQFAGSEILVTLSVRSGFDVLLKSAIELYQWQPGTEIVFSGMTIPDMPRIAQDHGLNVVGTGLDPETMSPTVEDIASKITSKTKAIVVAHLMGGKCDLEEISRIAKRHDLLLIVDCAQSFTGQSDDISPLADVSMFSFGAIKTNTSLGGAVLKVNDSDLLRLAGKHHKSWARQTNISLFKRVLKYLLLVKPISSWFPAWCVKTGFRWIGLNHDDMAAGMARGFAKGDFFKLIRRQPSLALLTLLARRLEQFDPATILTRTERGELLTRTIASQNESVAPLGLLAHSPTFWVYSIAVQNPDELINRLWNAGFDATNHSSLISVDPDNGDLNRLKSQMVFLPIDQPMPDREIVRMGNLVARVAKPAIPRDYATKAKVKVA